MKLCLPKLFLLISFLITWSDQSHAQVRANLSDYDDLIESPTGVTMTVKNRKFGILNSRGIEIAPPIYDVVYHFIQGAYGKVEKDGKKGIIDTNGKWIIPLEYDDIQFYGKGFKLINNHMYGAFMVKKNNLWGAINSYGKQVQPMEYIYFSGFEGGVGRIYKTITSGTGLINASGNVVAPMIYNTINEPSEGFAAFKRNGKYGFLSIHTGKEKVPPIYDWAYQFSDGYANVTLNEKKGFIDSTGRVIVPVEYEDVTYFSVGYAAVKKKGKWGFVDTKGNIIIECKFDDTRPFKNTRKGPRGMVKKKNDWYSIDASGKMEDADL